MTQPSPQALNNDEERLANALVSRGLITREDFARCRAANGAKPGSKGLLDRLVDGGFLTESQAVRAAQEIEAPPSQRIPGYQLVEKLGQGASGVVFKARQLSMDRWVAV